jgi:hypothetical protein
MGINITLNDKYELKEGRAYMTAIQALVRIPLVQRLFHQMIYYPLNVMSCRHAPLGRF